MNDDAQQMNDTQSPTDDMAANGQEEDVSRLVGEQKQSIEDESYVETSDQRLPTQDLAQKADAYLHGWRRAKADYENLKKEVERERKEMGAFARAMAAMDFIPIYDNFKKAAAHEPSLSDSEENKPFKQWMDGIKHIRSQFKEVLKQVGIEEIHTVGASFDPRVHEAVEEREGAGVPPGQIIAELSGGYKMGDRVLQAAKVIIAK